MTTYTRLACFFCMLTTIPATLLLAGELAFPRIGVADSMATVFRSRAISQIEAEAGTVAWQQPLRVHLAKNEFESGQIVIEAPADRALHEVQVACRPLVRDGDPDGIWPNTDISIWQQEEVEVYNLWAPHESLGWFPDPLVPLEKPLTVEAGRRQCVLVRFFAEANLCAGTYRSEIVVSAAGIPEMRVPVEVTVWDFTLPEEQHFTLSIPIWGGQMEKMYPGSQTVDRRRTYLDMLYDHRVAPFPLAEDEIQHAIERGVRDFNFICFAKDGVEHEKVKQVAEQAVQWREKGWDKLARTYVLLGDETPCKWYPYLREQGKLVHEAAPDVARRFTVSTEMISDIDWICRQMQGSADTVILGISSDALADRFSREVRAGGLGLWWYYVASHYYIPTDNAESRFVLWRHWKYQVPGQLHWGMTYWGEENIVGRDGKKWPEIPWDTKGCRGGDGYLVYPAPGGAAFWPSVRLEQLRDGIEDYEYFQLLKMLTDDLEQKHFSVAAHLISTNRQLLNIGDSLVKSYGVYDKDIMDYRHYRERIAQAIIATQEMIEKAH